MLIENQALITAIKKGRQFLVGDIFRAVVTIWSDTLALEAIIGV
jgi:hypothetical protein